MYANDHRHDSACEHCQKPSRELLAHMIPRTLRHDTTRQDIGQAFVMRRLCTACGAKRHEDLMAFIAGEAPTTLVSPGASL